jgi:hypothetical protein
MFDFHIFSVEYEKALLLIALLTQFEVTLCAHHPAKFRQLKLDCSFCSAAYVESALARRPVHTARHVPAASTDAERVIGSGPK